MHNVSSRGTRENSVFGRLKNGFNGHPINLLVANDDKYLY